MNPQLNKDYNTIAKLNKTFKLDTTQSNLVKCIATLLGSLLKVFRIKKLTVLTAFPALKSAEKHTTYSKQSDVLHLR